MMRDFLEGLEQNADRIISEAEEGGSSGSGQTFAQVSQGVKWGYIPQPKGASTSDADSGKGGFGSAKNSLLFIKENSPDSWDIVVMKYGRGGSLATDDDRAAFAAMRKRPSKSSEEDSSAKTDEAREITRYMALAEQVLNGKVLNEVAAGNVEGWTEMP